MKKQKQIVQSAYIPLILCTIFAWVIHAILVSLYFPYFQDPRSLLFRAIHGGEIFLVMSGAFSLFFQKYTLKMERAVIIVLATLGVIDLIFFRIAFADFQAFDIGHFIVAYFSVSLALVFTMQGNKK